MIGNAKQESVWYLEQQPCLAAQKARTARNQTEGWRCKKQTQMGSVTKPWPPHDAFAFLDVSLCVPAGVTCLLSAAGQAPHMADGVNLVFQV